MVFSWLSEAMGSAAIAVTTGIAAFFGFIQDPVSTTIVFENNDVIALAPLETRKLLSPDEILVEEPEFSEETDIVEEDTSSQEQEASKPEEVPTEEDVTEEESIIQEPAEEIIDEENTVQEEESEEIPETEVFQEIISDQPLEERIAASLVNIFCNYRTAESIRSATGSGVVIDEKGVILTNAHVAQFLLLAKAGEGTAACVVRSGNPAVAQYYADLLYISPQWINENRDVIIAKNPIGTGKDDYALLFASQAYGSNPLPTTFTYIPPHIEEIRSQDEFQYVFAGGYPAESFESVTANTPLVPVVASSTIDDIYTFGNQRADLISVRGTEVAQKGSSGGGVISDEGKLLGVIVTSSADVVITDRELRALSLPYIERNLIQNTGQGLDTTLSGNLAFKGEVFAEALVPFLSGIINDQIESAAK